MRADDVYDVLLEVADAVCRLVEGTPLAARRPVACGHDEQFAIDVAADRLAVARLTDAGLGVLSEESGRHGWDRAIRVVLDPIDGSSNCVRGLPSYGPSLCAVDRDGPLAAVVLNIPARATYGARRGAGATKNGSPMTPGPDSDELAVVAVGDPVAGLESFFWPRLYGASAHDLCLVAEGAVDGYVDFRNTQSIWDYLGATLIVQECGGVVRDRDGGGLVDLDAVASKRLIAARTGALCDRLQDAIGQTAAAAHTGAGMTPLGRST